MSAKVTLNRPDLTLLSAAAEQGESGVQSHRYSAAARQRLVGAGYLSESAATFKVGQYRSTLRITDEGHAALASVKT